MLLSGGVRGVIWRYGYLDRLAGADLSAWLGGDAPGWLLPGAIRARGGARRDRRAARRRCAAVRARVRRRIGDRVRDAAPGRSSPPAHATVDPDRRGGPGGQARARARADRQ